MWLSQRRGPGDIAYSQTLYFLFRDRQEHVWKYKPRATSTKGWWLEREKIDGVWTYLGATEICFSQEKQITIDSRLEKSLNVTILFPWHQCIVEQK